MKIKLFLARLATLQPWPYIGYSRDSNLSFLFYRKVKGSNCLFERNWIGSKWSSFWWWLIKKI